MTSMQNTFIFNLKEMGKTWIHKSRKWVQSNNGDYLELKIIVQEKDETYDISYIWNMENCKTLSNLRPNEIFTIYNFDFKDECCIGDEDSSGVIVNKNEMTKIMIEYLLMNNEELCKYSGLTEVNTYRQIIMKNLENLWD